MRQNVKFDEKLFSARIKTNMTTATLQRKVVQIERFIKKASRALLEFEIAQSEWDYAHGRYKAYKSADHFMKHIMKKVNS